jgi:hypothetical protein
MAKLKRKQFFEENVDTELAEATRRVAQFPLSNF